MQRLNKRIVLLFICFLFIVSGCSLFTKKLYFYSPEYKNQEEFLADQDYLKDLSVEKLDIEYTEKDTVELDYCTIKGNEINFSISNYSTKFEYLFSSYLNEDFALEKTNIEIDTAKQRFIIDLLPKTCPDPPFQSISEPNQNHYVPLMYLKRYKFILNLPPSLKRVDTLYRYAGYDSCSTLHPIRLGSYSNYKLYLRLGIYPLPNMLTSPGYVIWTDEKLYLERFLSFIPEILFEIELNSSAEILFEK